MRRFAEVRHRQWIGAPLDAVRAQFADLDHHIAQEVHPGLRFQVLERRPGGARFVQEVQLPLPPLPGPLPRPLLEAQIRKAVQAAALEDRADIEPRGHPRAAAA